MNTKGKEGGEVTKVYTRVTRFRLPTTRPLPKVVGYQSRLPREVEGGGGGQVTEAKTNQVTTVRLGGGGGSGYRGDISGCENNSFHSDPSFGQLLAAIETQYTV